MHQHSEHPEFVKTIKDIRDAEEEHDRVINSSKDKAERIVREAKERILDERAKSEEEAVAFKNEQIKKGSEGIESEVQKMIKKAREDGAKISTKDLGEPAIAKLVKDFLGSL